MLSGAATSSARSLPCITRKKLLRALDMQLNALRRLCRIHRHHFRSEFIHSAGIPSVWSSSLQRPTVTPARAGLCTSSKYTAVQPLRIDTFKDIQSAIRKVMLSIHPDVMQRYDLKVQAANQAAVSGLLSFVKYAEKASSAHKATKPISATDPDAAHSLKIYFAPHELESTPTSSTTGLRAFKYDLRAPASLLYRTEVASRKRRDAQLHAEWLHTAMAAVQGILTRLGSDLQLQLAEHHQLFLSEKYSDGQSGGGDKQKHSAQSVEPSQFAARRMMLQHAYVNDPNTHTDWMHSRRTPLHAASPLSERQVDVIVGRFLSKNVDVAQLPAAQRAAVLARLAGCCVRHFAALRLHEAPWRGILLVVGGAYLAQLQRNTLYIPATFGDAEFVLWAQQQYGKMAPGLLQAGLERGGLQLGCQPPAQQAGTAARGAAGRRPTASSRTADTSADTPPAARTTAPTADTPLRSFVAELRKRRAAVGGSTEPAPTR